MKTFDWTPNQATGFFMSELWLQPEQHVNKVAMRMGMMLNVINSSLGTGQEHYSSIDMYTHEGDLLLQVQKL